MTQNGKEFRSIIPWVSTAADCIVLSCSDHRFEKQIEELITHLGFKYPHIIQFPSGPAAAIPLISAFGFLAKAIDKLMEKAMELTHVKTIICVAHEDCGGYKAGNIKLLDYSVRKLSGKSVQEIQIDHLQKAASRFEKTLHGMEVMAFFAGVTEEQENKQLVVFKEVPIE